MKKVLILYSIYTPTIDAIIYQLNNTAIVTCADEKNYNKINFSDYDLIVLSNYNKTFNKNAITLSHSLIPPFNTQKPEKEILMKGYKIAGVTIYNTQTKKIYSQYPIFVHNDTHYETLVKELDYVEQILYPLVIEKLIKNEPFETQELLRVKSSCGGCCGCNH